MTTVWINGALVDDAEARISPFDHGFLTGDGVFETLRVYRGTPFAARRHLERLARSAAGLQLPLPDAGVLRQAIDDLVDALALAEGRLRVTVTAGVSVPRSGGPLGSDRGVGAPTVIVAAGPLAEWPAVADVTVAPWPRNERGALVGLKTTSYAENVVALAEARRRGCHEAVFANLNGHLCEGTATNVFVGIDGRLMTPPLSSGCLAGVTRELVMELVPTEERVLPLSALASADEAFLTSSTREVQPVRAVDGSVVGAAPGPLTRAAAAAFSDLVERDLDP